MPNLKKGDKVIICGEVYHLLKPLYVLKGFQFRTWLVKNFSNSKEYVAKMTQDPNKALNELRTYIYLKTKGYPERYYAEMVAFDHQALHIKSGGTFYCILLKYLPEEHFQSLDEYLRRSVDGKTRKRLADKLKRRVSKLHELGISHGDIREANIMVRETKRGVGLRLIDFGLSKFNDEKEKQKDKKRVEALIKKIINFELEID